MEKKCVEFKAFYVNGNTPKGFIQSLKANGWEVLCKKPEKGTIRLWCKKETIKVIDIQRA